jgi:hypothetical protein
MNLGLLLGYNGEPVEKPKKNRNDIKDIGSFK